MLENIGGGLARPGCRSDRFAHVDRAVGCAELQVTSATARPDGRAVASASRRGHCMTKRSTFSSRVLRAMALGLQGILALLLALPEIEGVPRLALLASPAIFLLLAALAGAAFAGRLGLRSRLLAGDALAASALAMPAVAGLASGLIMAGLDEFLARTWREISDAPSLISGWSPQQFIVGLLYGAVNEEILMRGVSCRRSRRSSCASSAEGAGDGRAPWLPPSFSRPNSSRRRIFLRSISTAFPGPAGGAHARAQRPARSVLRSGLRPPRS